MTTGAAANDSDAPSRAGTQAGLVAAIIVMGVAAACGAPGPSRDDFIDLPGLGETRIDVPRPTTHDQAPCTVALPARDSVAERGVALRDIGLFSDQRALTDAELAEYLDERLAAEWGEVPADDPYLELLVASVDQERVWWRDLEADVVEGNEVYVAVLQEWADISLGSFTPTSIEETWGSEEGPVHVRFLEDEEPVELNPAYLEDWIDPNIATTVNQRIADSGRQFEFFQAFDQTAFVMALNAGEREALLDRGWCFE